MIYEYSQLMDRHCLVDFDMVYFRPNALSRSLLRILSIFFADIALRRKTEMHVLVVTNFFGDPDHFPRFRNSIF